MICPLSGEEITDPIVVFFENLTKKTYQASVFLAKFDQAFTRKLDGFECNVKKIESENPAHQEAINAILDLPYAALGSVQRFSTLTAVVDGLSFNGDSSSPNSFNSNHSGLSNK